MFVVILTACFFSADNTTSEVEVIEAFLVQCTCPSV